MLLCCLSQMCHKQPLTFWATFPICKGHLTMFWHPVDLLLCWNLQWVPFNSLCKAGSAHTSQSPKHLHLSAALPLPEATGAYSTAHCGHSFPSVTVRTCAATVVTSVAQLLVNLLLKSNSGCPQLAEERKPKLLGRHKDSDASSTLALQSVTAHRRDVLLGCPSEPRLIFHSHRKPCGSSGWSLAPCHFSRGKTWGMAGRKDRSFSF